MSQADLFVYIALALGWGGLAAWAYRIGRKVTRLENRSGEAKGSE